LLEVNDDEAGAAEEEEEDEDDEEGDGMAAEHVLLERDFGEILLTLCATRASFGYISNNRFTSSLSNANTDTLPWSV
jgi:hypothetical protein